MSAGSASARAATPESTGCTPPRPNDVKMTAICDTYDGYIARAKDRVQTVWGNTPTTYKDYHELLADKSIDAVFIMTPEHLHHDMAIAALKAGKHVYVEKPLAHTIEEGWDIIDAWKKSGKVCQVGTQNRSSSLYKKAKELVKQGMIGDVHYVRAFWYRNSEPSPTTRCRGATSSPPRPRRRTPIGTSSWAPRPSAPGTRPLLPMAPLLGLLRRHLHRPAGAPDRYRQFHARQDRAQHLHGVRRHLPVGRTTIATLPTPSAPSTITDNFQLNYSCYFGNDHYGYGEQLCGNEGTIEVLNRMDLYWYPEVFDPKNPPKKEPIHINGPETFKERDGAINHFRNFIEAIQGKEQVIAPPPVGQQAAISGHMATLSFKQQKKIVWDDPAHKYRFV